MTEEMESWPGMRSRTCQEERERLQDSSATTANAIESSRPSPEVLSFQQIQSGFPWKRTSQMSTTEDGGTQRKKVSVVQ